MRRALRTAIVPVLAALFWAAAGPGTGLAQTVDAADPESVAEVIRAMGYAAELDVDEEGDPIVHGTMGGTEYSIFFYGCTDNADCKYLLFIAGFDMPAGTPLAVVNQWNDTQLAGRAFLDDESDPWLDYFVTTLGGLSRENFEDVVDWWRVALRQFKDHIGF